MNPSEAACTPADGEPATELTSNRLLLRLIRTEEAAAVLDGRRLPDWAPDFPSAGDREIAGLLSRTGLPTGPGRIYGHRLVVERESGLVVGGVGFFGPPADGRIEIGYGIVESRRRRGYATEAVTAMLACAFTQPEVQEVVATADLDNPASIRVLDRSGLTRRSENESQVTYGISRSP